MPKKKLNLGSIKFPLEAATKSEAFLGKRGSGKTYNAAVYAEELHKAGIPILVFDPIDVWWGLKLGADGRSKGLDVVVFGIDHADIPLTKDMGPEIVDAIIENEASAVISTFGMPKKQQRYLITEIAEQLLIKNDSPRKVFIEEAHEFCLDEETELLTDNGWLKSQLITTETIAVNYDLKTETYSYGKVKRVIRKKHSGEMIKLNSDGIDCLCTPDHRVVIQRFQHDPKRYKMYDPTICQADKLPNGGFYIPIGGSPIGSGIDNLSVELSRILGWVISDGHRHQKNKPYLCITQSPNKIKRNVNIYELMSGILGNYGATEHIRNRITKLPQGTICETIECRFYLGKKLSLKLQEFLNGEIHRIPRDILLNGTKKQLQMLFNGLMEGDGTAVGGYKGRWRTFFAGKNELLADDVLELCTKLNINAVKTEYNSQWLIRLSSRKRHYIRKPKLSKYKGIVWDITVPTGAFVVRRNGKVFVTGNCPQRIGNDQTRMFNAVSNLVVMGRNRGIGVCLINQRAATINKDVLTQIDTLIALRNVGPQDRKALKEWVENYSAQELFDEFMAELPKIQTGEGWIWSPEFLDVFKKVKFRERITFHPDREKLGVKFKMPDMKKLDVSGFAERFKSKIEAKREEKKSDKDKITELTAEVRKLQSENKKVPQELIDRINAELEADWIKKYNEASEELKKEMKKIFDALLPKFKSLSDAFNRSYEICKPLIAEIESILGKPIEEIDFKTPELKQSHMIKKLRQSGKTITTHNAFLPYARETVQPVDGELGGAQLKVLTTLVEFCPMKLTRTQLALNSGYRPTSGHFKNTLSELYKKGYMDRGNGEFWANDAGLAYFGKDRPEPKTRDEIISMWLEVLPKVAKLIFEFMLSHGTIVTKEFIAMHLNYRVPVSGHFKNNISILTKNKLIVRKDDGYIINPDLGMK